MRGKVSSVTVAVLAVLLVACDKSAEEAQPTFDVAAGLAAVKAARAELDQATAARNQIRTELQALKDMQRRNDEETARMGELETELTNADTAVDMAFSEDQGQLAAFLNQALNEIPQAPETQEALGLYSEGAIRTGQEFIEKAGDYRRALETMDTAKSYFEAVALPIPSALESAIADAKALRYLTQERFDQLRKGMTEDQVKAITGTPFYANIRESEVRGKKIVSWLFNREDEEVAAVYFEKGKAYALKWNVKDN